MNLSRHAALLACVALLLSSCIGGNQASTTTPSANTMTQGPTGPQGPAGVNGNTILSGTGAPSNTLGVEGDFYLDTATALLYGPKTAAGWGGGVSLQGPTGVNGNTILNGVGAPSPSLGALGDLYLDTANATFYGPKGATGWGTGIALLTPSTLVNTGTAPQWTVRYRAGMPSMNYATLRHNGSQWLYMGCGNQTGQHTAATSQDGHRWNSSLLTTNCNTTQLVSWGANQWLGIVNNGAISSTLSQNGQNWSNPTFINIDGVSSLSLFSSPTIQSLDYGTTRWVMTAFINGASKFLNSSDGLNWISSAPVDANNNPASVSTFRSYVRP